MKFLSGKKSCPKRRRAEAVDKRSVKEQKRPKEEGNERVQRGRGGKRREKKNEVGREERKGMGHASPRAMQPERRIIRAYIYIYI